MIHFLIPPESTIDLQHAFYEIGCRLGVPFSIHLTSNAIPSDAIVVRYCSTELERTPQHLIDLPVSIDAPPGLIHHHNLDLWAAPTEAGTPDIVAGCRDLISFAHEASVPSHQLDSFGRIPALQHPLNQQGAASVSLFENNARLLASRIRETGITYQPANPWGEPSRYAVCLSHDTDGPRLHHPFALMRSLIYGLLKGNRHERDSFELGVITKLKKRPDPYWNFDHWTKLERHFGMAPTYFVHPGSGADTRRHPRDPRYDIFQAPFPATLRCLQDSGAEIALHNPINSHSVKGYREGIDRLYRATGIQAFGGRAHYWAIDWHNPYSSWQSMSDANLTYDASLNLQALGYRGGSMLPITPSFRWTDTGKPFVALPTAVMDAYTVPRHSAHKREEIENALTQLLRNSTQGGGLLILDWHVRSLANTGTWQGYLAPLISIIKSLVQDSNCRFVTHRQAASDWNTHCNSLYRPATKEDHHLG
ncbi:MAG: hypothetical protein M3H12_13570 [Chromatiales bacterium]|nr:hypothetical protein [Gammaproteobacteria bacterium]